MCLPAPRSVLISLIWQSLAIAHTGFEIKYSRLMSIADCSCQIYDMSPVMVTANSVIRRHDSVFSPGKNASSKTLSLGAAEVHSTIPPPAGDRRRAPTRDR